MIARELLVKLGFNIDTTKLDKFKQMSDDVKSRMSSLQQGFEESISPDVKTKIQALAAYREEILGLSREERAEVLELNKVEKQAIKEVTQLEKQKHQKIKALEQERVVRVRQHKQALKELVNVGKDIGRKATMLSAAIAGGFALSLRGVLKDAEKQKAGESTGSKFDGEQLKTIDDFNKSFGETKKNLLEVRNAFVTDMIPAIVEFLKPINEWLRANKELLKQRMKQVVTALGKAFGILATVVMKVLGILDPLIDKTIGWGGAIAGVMAIGFIGWAASFAGSLGFVATAMKTLTVATWGFLRTPLGLIIIGITAALTLLIDEIYVTIKGGDSLINRFLNSEYWVFCKNRIDDVAQALKFLFSMSKKVADFMDPFAQFDNLKEMDSVLRDKWSKQTKFGENADNEIKHIASWQTPKLSAADFIPPSVTNNSNQNKSNTVNQKNSFNMTINVPKGTTVEQSKDISNVVKEELARHMGYANEKTLSAIGVY